MTQPAAAPIVELRLAPPASRPTQVLVGPGASRCLARVWRPPWRGAALVADEHVMPLHGAELRRELERLAGWAVCCELRPGEAHKTRSAKAQLEDRLLAAGLGRDGCVVALGGGVTLDLAGFAAATYLRGIEAIYVPTTLLAQVDAAIGGKTGVNTPAGKNLVGAFHPPTAVLVDPDLLETLPAAQWPNGLSELVKIAAVADEPLFQLLEAREARLREQQGVDAELLGWALGIKARLVERDEREVGPRAILGFGHTVGHALEAATEHRIEHGCAVAIGMASEARVACRCAGLPEAARCRLLELLRALGLPTHAATVPFAALVPHLGVDKKRRRGSIRLVLPSAIGVVASGDGSYTVPVDLELLRDAWSEGP